ncbi:MAG: 30S ribosomal protein S8e [Candidatus Thermoplasmatota archaeon]|jgi:small subunit ribosomal protein S8e|nr:30S ribosomal protein S8e [Candidatus Thermoplasmatota archaeon]
MAIYHGKGRVKISGGILRKNRHKMRYELGREPTNTVFGKEKRKIIKGIGGNSKQFLLSAEFVNVTIPDEKKTKKVKITNVKENIADPHFAQRNVITKGAILETELGLARVTSRPGQDGQINAILIKK